MEDVVFVCNKWNDTVCFQSSFWVLSVTRFCHQLSPQNLSVDLCFIKVWLLPMSPAMRNISGSFKYLQLWGISPAPSNISGFEMYHSFDFSNCLQLWTISPVFSNVSSYEEYLWLPQISLALKNISSSLKYLWLRRISPALDYFRIHFFLVEMWFKKSWSSRVFFVDWNYASATMRNLTY